MKNDAEALGWYRRAADQGGASAMVFLGGMYQRGQGATQDYVQAVYWIGQAADRGEAGAMFLLGTFNREGRGVPQDCGLARHWFEESVAAGDDDAKAFLRDDVICPDTATPSMGIPSSEDLLAKAHAATDRGDDAVALRLYRLAADKCDARAMVPLGIGYMTGHGVPGSPAGAMQWLIMAADRGNSGAGVIIASYYVAMFGAAQDCQMAREWLEKSVAAGNDRANTPLEARIFGECRW